VCMPSCRPTGFILLADLSVLSLGLTHNSSFPLPPFPSFIPADQAMYKA